jgi:hypothetical protein
VSTLALLIQAVALAGRLQNGVVVTPDSVRVGDPFTVSIRVRAPQGSVIEFPQAPDSSIAVEPLDPVFIRTTADSTSIDQTAEYRLTAWRIGSLPISFPDVLVRQDIGTRQVPITGVGIVVVSVLPADTAQHVPKPPRDVFSFGVPWWVGTLIGAMALALAALLWWLLRRRRQRPPVPIPAIVTAEREFERIEALGLVAAGEMARHVDLMVEVLRDYVAVMVPGASTSLTSSELSACLRRARLAPHIRCAALLAESDLVKFAGRPISGERATALGREARAIATAVEQARLPAPVGKAA